MTSNQNSSATINNNKFILNSSISIEIQNAYNIYNFEAKVKSYIEIQVVYLLRLDSLYMTNLNQQHILM